LDEFFSDVTLRPADGVGHFSPLEAPQLFAEQVKAALDRRRRPFVGGSARRGSAGNRPRPPPSACGAAPANTKQQPPPRFICGRGLIRSASATIVSRVVTRTNERRRDGDRSEVPEVIAWKAAEHRDH
jgi:hypothetical protein